MAIYQYSSKLGVHLGTMSRVCCVVFSSLLITTGAIAADINLEQPSTRNLPAYFLADSSTQASTATSIDSTKATSAENLYIESGLKELIGQIPVSTARSFEAALTAQQLPDLFLAVDQEDVAEAVNNAFKVETFDKYLVQQLNNAMSEESREFILQWYASPLGMRVKQAEIDNSLLTDHDRFDNYQVFLRHYPADAAREELIQQLDVTLKSTEAALDMMSSIQIAFNLSLTRFMPEEHRLSRQEIVDLAERSQQELLLHYQKKTKDVLLFTYQALNDEDLVKLNEVLGTDAGQEFVVAINNGPSSRSSFDRVLACQKSALTPCQLVASLSYKNHVLALIHHQTTAKLTFYDYWRMQLRCSFI